MEALKGQLRDSNRLRLFAAVGNAFAQHGGTDTSSITRQTSFFGTVHHIEGGSIAEWLACWTQAQKGLGSNRSRDAVG